MICAMPIGLRRQQTNIWCQNHEQFKSVTASFMLQYREDFKMDVEVIMSRLIWCLDISLRFGIKVFIVLPSFVRLLQKMESENKIGKAASLDSLSWRLKSASRALSKRLLQKYSYGGVNLPCLLDALHLAPSSVLWLNFQMWMTKWQKGWALRFLYNRLCIVCFLTNHPVQHLKICFFSMMQSFLCKHERL